MTTKQTTALVFSLLAVLGLALGFAPREADQIIGGDQRHGLVAQAVLFEETSTFYPSGPEYVQAVYASQDITISADLEADSYSAEAGALPGDVVVGEGWAGILIDETTAMGVADDGGMVQVFRVTNEDIRRVDW